MEGATELTTVIWGMPPTVFAAAVTGSSVLFSAVIAYSTSKNLTKIPKEMDFYSRTIDRYEAVRQKLASIRQQAVVYDDYCDRKGIRSGERSLVIPDFHALLDSIVTITESNAELFSARMATQARFARNSGEVNFEAVDQILSQAFDDLGKLIRQARRKMGIK